MSGRRPVRLVVALGLVVVGLGAVGWWAGDPAGAQGREKVIEVRTVPPLAGVTVEIDGKPVTTGETGVGWVLTDGTGAISTRLEVTTQHLDDPDGVRRYTFNRLYTADGDAIVTFNTERLVGFEFFTVQGEPVAPAEIDSMAIRSSIGEVIRDVPLDRPVWLRAARVVTTSDGPEQRDIQWSLESVNIGTSNLVNRAQVRFLPLEQYDIDVELLFFSARFRVADAFFGYTQGDGITLVSPDGVATYHEVDDAGEVFLPRLPRGEYLVTVEGPGLRIERPVTLTRDQEIELKLLSWVDLSVAALGLMLFVCVPLAVGFRRRRRRRRHLAGRPPRPVHRVPAGVR